MRGRRCLALAMATLLTAGETSVQARMNPHPACVVLQSLLVFPIDASDIRRLLVHDPIGFKVKKKRRLT